MARYRAGGRGMSGEAVPSPRAAGPLGPGRSPVSSVRRLYSFSDEAAASAMAPVTAAPPATA